MTLPNWIRFNKQTGYYTLLEIAKCLRCSFTWYPRINQDGSMKLSMCPKCKSKLWNEKNLA